MSAENTPDNGSLSIKSYEINWDHHPDGLRGGGVCTYIKKYLPARRLSDLFWVPYFWVMYNNKKWYMISLYSSPSQTANEFDSFGINFEKLVVLYI